MDITLRSGELHAQASELWAVGLFEGEGGFSPALRALDALLGGRITQLVEAGDVKGKAKELTLLYPFGALAAQRLLLVGLGKRESVTAEVVRSAAGLAARRARELELAAFDCEVLGATELGSANAAQAVAEGIGLGLYEFTRLKSDAKASKLQAVNLYLPGGADRAAAEAGLAAARAIIAGVTLARDLVNLPANIATPTYLAEQAAEMASRTGLACRVLERAEMAELGMGALLAVAQGSNEPPKFIILEHNAGRGDLETLVLVGKGITFDSGGISLKPGDGMERMKTDMAGGAAVIGALRAVAELDLPLHVVGLVPATENMPGGRAYRPGDVVRAMNGKTIEVISTDAEGRLVLADALCYAARYQPKAVVDIATLTGARTIALGNHAIGLFSTDDGLIARLDAAGIKTWERVWAMPMFEEYADDLKSFSADLKHTGGRPAGSIVAAMFLSKFTNYPWAHLDIAGLASTETDLPYTPRWATGIGVRLLVQFLRDWHTESP